MGLDKGPECPPLSMRSTGRLAVRQALGRNAVHRAMHQLGRHIVLENGLRGGPPKTWRVMHSSG